MSNLDLSGEIKNRILTIARRLDRAYGFNGNEVGAIANRLLGAALAALSAYDERRCA